MKPNQRTEIYRLLILNKIDLDGAERIAEKINAIFKHKENRGITAPAKPTMKNRCKKN